VAFVLAIGVLVTAKVQSAGTDNGSVAPFQGHGGRN
jgi:hypothetical protein